MASSGTAVSIQRLARAKFSRGASKSLNPAQRPILFGDSHVPAVSTPFLKIDRTEDTASTT